MRFTDEEEDRPEMNRRERDRLKVLYGVLRGSKIAAPLVDSNLSFPSISFNSNSIPLHGHRLRPEFQRRGCQDCSSGRRPSQVIARKYFTYLIKVTTRLISAKPRKVLCSFHDIQHLHDPPRILNIVRLRRRKGASPNEMRQENDIQTCVQTLNIDGEVLTKNTKGRKSFRLAALVFKPPQGFEPWTSALRKRRSTAELRRRY